MAKHFRAEITFEEGSKGEFWIEAIGDKGGYGLLDPTFASISGESWYNQRMEHLMAEIFDKYGVVLGYIFGSHARGTAGPLSDIDVAVAFPFGLNDEEQTEKIGNIRSEIQRTFRTDYVDVINLMQNNNPALRYSILFGGKTILVKDSNLKTSLELKAVREYEDTKYLRNVQSVILRNKFNVATK